MNVIVPWALGLLSTISLAALGWAFTINTKVNVNEATSKIRQDDLKELINEKFDSVDNQFSYLVDRLARIERAMNGSLKGH